MRLFLNAIVVRNYSRWVHRRPRRIFAPDGNDSESIHLPTPNDGPQLEQTTKYVEKSAPHNSPRTINMNDVDKISIIRPEITNKRKPKKDTLLLSCQKKARTTTDMMQTVIDPEGNLIYTKMRDDDPVIGRLMVAVKSRNERNKKHLVLLEGKRLIREALMANCKLDSLIFSRKSDVDDILSFLPKSGANIYKVPYKEIQMWSDLTTTPGIMGIFKTPQLDGKWAHRKGILPIKIVCDNVREPGNLGSILRVAAGVGVDQVILTKGCVDLWDTKVVRSAAGCHFRVPITFKQNWDDVYNCVKPTTSVFIADNRLVNQVDNSYDLTATTIESIPLLPYYSIDYQQCGELLLVIGGETEGLSSTTYKLASDFQGVRLNIPLHSQVESLNTGVALGVILFEIKRQLTNLKAQSVYANEPK